MTVGGLSSDVARRLLAQEGPNELPREPAPTVAARFGRQLADPMIMLLCGAWVLVVVIGDVADAVIIGAVVVLNSTIGVVQDLRAQRAVDALEQMAAPTAWCWRDGALTSLRAVHLVRGDLVRLEAGDVVPADLRLVEASDLQVDESAMTGESVPVARASGDEALSGTVVTRGRAVATVVRTGARSSLGRIASEVGVRLRPTPLQRRLQLLSLQLVVVVATVCVAVLVLALSQGQRWDQAVVLAVSLGVAAVPESLPAVVTVALAVGAHRMAQRNAVVRRLAAVETLGSVSVLATDKTGTITPGLLTVTRVWTSDGSVDVSGAGHEVAGSLHGPPGALAAATRVLEAAALCNDATLLPAPTSAEWSSVGDPFDVALLVAAHKAGVDREHLAPWRRREERPFDADAGFARTVHENAHGDRFEVIKGAPETVLDLVPGGAPAQARQEVAAMAVEGQRVLAVLAVRGDRAEVGLVAVSDPPRPAAASLVERCRAAGIRPVLITGDHPLTAANVGRRIGLLDPGQLADGEAVRRGEHVAQVANIDVYARTRPHQKVEIVEAWQAAGAVVAMTGDGVNDAPALRRADIGVAMGGRGTEVARQAADMVLMDDDLATVVEAVAEGRRIYANIRSFLRYGLGGGLAEVLVLLCAPLLGWPIPLTPAMILWVNMLTHGLPGVAFGGEPLDPAAMSRPSPSPARSVLDRRLAVQVAQGGSVIALLCLGAGWWAWSQGVHVPTAVFATLGLGQLALALALRAPRRGWHLRERWLEVAVAGAAVAQVGAVVVPGLADLVGAEPLALTDLLFLSLLASGAGVVTRAVDGAERWGRRSRG